MAELDGRIPKVSSGFGEVRTRPNGSKRRHEGSDVTYARRAGESPTLPYGTPGHYTPIGTLAYAAAAGRVSVAERIGTGGYVKLWHADDWASQYLHLLAWWVFPGMRVHAGQALGIVWHNPDGYRFNHLHFQIRAPSDEIVDPEWVMGKDLRDVPRPRRPSSARIAVAGLVVAGSALAARRLAG